MQFTLHYVFTDGSSTIAHVECRNERKLGKLLNNQFKENNKIQYVDIEWKIDSNNYADVARINGIVL